jgi:hypothetical protein
MLKCSWQPLFNSNLSSSLFFSLKWLFNLRKKEEKRNKGEKGKERKEKEKGKRKRKEERWKEKERRRNIKKPKET